MQTFRIIQCLISKVSILVVAFMESVLSWCFICKVSFIDWCVICKVSLLVGALYYIMQSVLIIWCF